MSGNWTLLFGGVALIVTLIQDPDGVAGSMLRTRRQARDGWRRRWLARAAEGEPSPSSAVER